MQMAHQFDVSTLNWVKGEIDESIKQARIALEAYVEEPDDDTQLRACIVQLHQVSGTLEMVELGGAARFAKEVERLALAIELKEFEADEVAYEILMRALLQLPYYLESLQEGHRDNLMPVLPLINEIRQLRGAETLDVAAFFTPDLSVNPPEELQETAAGAESLVDVARESRRYYQAALLKLLRGEEIGKNLGVFAAVFHKLLQVAETESVRRWLWVSRGFATGIRAKSIPVDRESKSLLGKFDNLLKRLIETGESGLDTRSLQDATRAALYHVAKARANTPQLQELKEAFSLSEYLPSDEGVQPSGAMGGFNADLKQTVSADVLEELTRVKDALDVFVRGDRSVLEPLKPMAESLSSIADTLKMLQEDGLSQTVNQQVAAIQALVDGSKEANDTNIMDIAGAVLEVESALKDWGSLAPVEKADAVSEQVSEEEASPQAEAEHRRVIRQVMKEAKDDLVLVRESITLYIDDQGNRKGLEEAPGKLHQIAGGMELLSYKRVAQILGSCQQFITERLIESETLPDDAHLDQLADAMMSIEYYLEAFVQSKVHPGSALDVAEEAVSELGYPISEVKEPAVEAEEEAALAAIEEGEEFAEAVSVEMAPEELPFAAEEIELAETLELEAPEAEELPTELKITEPAEVMLEEIEPSAVIEEAGEEELLSSESLSFGEVVAETELAVEELAEHELPEFEIEAAPEERAEIAGVEIAETIAESAPVAEPQPEMATGEELDDEIIEIFVEEAEEEFEKIAELLPRWKAAPADDEALRDLRRSFHTLKGSGRLVGAAEVGEFAWAFEDMLNRVLDGSVSHNNVMFDVLNMAQEALVQLLEQFRGGAAPTADIEMLIEAAEDLGKPEGMQLPEAAVQAAEEIPEKAAEAAQPVEEEEPVAELSIDPVLLEIYTSESETHLEAIREFLAHARAGEGSRVTEPLIRALHTLQGSSRMAGIDAVAEVSSVLEKYAKTLQAEHHSVEENGLSVLEDTVSYIDAMVAYLQDTSQPSPTRSGIQARADELYHSVQHLEEKAIVEPEAGLARVPEEEEALAEEPVEELEAIEIVEPAVEVEEAGIELPEFEMEGAEAAIEIAEPVAEVEEAGIELTELEMEGAEEPIEIPDLMAEGWEEPTAGVEAEAEEEAVEIPQVVVEAEEAIEIPDLMAEGWEEPTAGIEAEAEVGEEAAEIPQLAAETEEAPSAAEPFEEYDEELLEIFLEEGTEILDASEETLQSWIEHPDDRSLAEALQRQLHTLKGGARMAGVTPIGNLSHSLESTFEGVVEGRLKRSKEMMELLQLALDRLVLMLEKVQHHEPLVSGDDLIERVDALAKTSEEGLTAESVEAAPEAVAEQISEEVEIAESAAKPELAEAPLHPLFGAAVESLEKIKRNIQGWKAAKDDSDLIESLQDNVRILAVEAANQEVVEIGDIANCLQEAIQHILDGHIIVTEEIQILFEQSADIVARQIEQMVSGETVESPRIQIQLIEEFIEKNLQEEAAPQEVDALAEERAAEEKRQIENRRKGARVQQEAVRVRSDLLNNMVNYAGEVSIYRSRVEQQIGSFHFNIDELDQTVARLRDQLRQFDIETEAQIDSRKQEAAELGYEDFDPLEFDRFTTMQQLSRSMMESLSDLVSIEEALLGLTRESETLLLQQSRVNTELQESLMQTRMVPLVENAPRLRRIVRQTCSELGKNAKISFSGAEVKMDRTVVERMMAPLEHMLRNAIAHGIEMPGERIAKGKSPEGKIRVALSREGSEVVINVSDDGTGIDLEKVHEKALSRGLISEDVELGDRELMQFILESGLSTADSLSQISGRGVGMDVVNSEIKQLSGVLTIDSQKGHGTTFTIRLPLTLSVSRALLVNAGEDIYAIPLLGVQGIERVARDELNELLSTEQARYHWVGQDYDILNLSTIIGATPTATISESKKLPLLLTQSGDHHVALVVDGLLGSREIVVKSLGPQLSTLSDLAGATILADGSVALIIDMPSLIRHGIAKHAADVAAQFEEVADEAAVAAEPLVMVVDDSITVRKVTERLLKRNEMRTITAKDGVDALAVLEDQMPDVMLLDIEMPRMDGYELATHIRNSEKLKHIPIIMITSRTGEKHKQRALEIGVDVYMGKPFTETDLLENIKSLIEEQA